MEIRGNFSDTLAHFVRDVFVVEVTGSVVVPKFPLPRTTGWQKVCDNFDTPLFSFTLSCACARVSGLI